MNTVEKSASNLTMNQLVESATSMSGMGVAAAAAVPVLLMSLSMSINTASLILWVAAALVGGWLFGILMHFISRPRFDTLLDTYVQTLEQVVRGDLRQRLDVSGLAANSDEEKMLVRLG